MMRFTTIRTADGHQVARVDGDGLTLLPFEDVGALLASGTDWKQQGRVAGPKLALAEADLAPLVPHPEKIFCVGLNYADHAAEGNLELPVYPTLFAKFARSLIGANDDLVLPMVSNAVDWELELGVVIGSTIRGADETEALAAVGGYTIINDITMRDWQLHTSQYQAGKTFERSTPVGPFLVTPDEVDPTAGLRMRLLVDGQVMQDSSTDQLAIGVGKIISYISTIITLVPGDLIATGTPAGVGAVRTPPRYLVAGSVVQGSIEGLGVQTTHCVAPDLESSKPVDQWEMSL
jgi:acylpyruvate hydrolase